MKTVFFRSHAPANRYKALAAKGGVIQINYLDSFIDEPLYQYSLKTREASRALMQQLGGFTPENAAKVREEMAKQFGPAPKVTWEKIVEHIDHAVKLVGANHVGLGSDFDGGSMPEGMKDATALPKLTEALLRKGYSEKDVRKILGENTVRLLGEVEKAAKK